LAFPVISLPARLTASVVPTAFAVAKEGANGLASGRREAEGKALETELSQPRALEPLHSYGGRLRHENECATFVEQDVARFGRLDVGLSTMPAPKENLARWPSRTSESYAGVSTPMWLGTLLSLSTNCGFMQPQG